MSEPVIVRSVAPSDFDQWALLWAGYNRFYDRVLPSEVTQMTWARFLDSQEPVNGLVAERDGLLVGLAHYIFHRNTTMLGYTCYMQDLFTHEAARNEGVGRALIGVVYERARIAGSPRVYWQTQETNLTAMKLYDKVSARSGFIVYRTNL